ncbi:putative sgc region protein SgcQ [Phycisphaerae bacterium RAS1]|nr:putative sgc region protein SgcQ [Phycisphaerae bacterium RAS1]
MPSWYSSLFGVQKPVIGMLHLLPLPGSPGFAGDWEAVRTRLMEDVQALASGGVHALMIENFGDAPFFPRRVPRATVAFMTALAADVRRATTLPLGINVLRNDGVSGVAIAAAVGAQFIRVNVLCGARVTDQGVIDGIAHKLLRERAALAARGVRIFADVSVKHSAPLGSPRPIEDEVADTLHRGGADALVVSGSGTGRPTDPELVRRVKAAAGDAPVLVGSGVDTETLPELAPLADGFIVGTSLKVGGKSSAPIDPPRVRAFMQGLRA